MIRPEAVLFDCDGVVVDSEGPTLALFVEELAAHGLPLTLEDFETDYLGQTVEMVARQATAAGARLPQGWVAHFYSRMNELLIAGVPLVPGVLPVLDRLDAVGVPYAMGSNGSLAKMKITLGQHGIEGRFRAVLSGQALGAPKPAPDVYLAAAAACRVRPEACVVIEDSAMGARAALAAGMRCFGYAAHGHKTPTARSVAALGVPLFHRMEDLPGLLGIGAL
ncbi:HAD family phosphatase [Tabrizicola sp.]|uniref:HAD family hydrolase n=1 Tax=Tabrizicola sp. TaxID=2005166 RepID=UPI002732F7A3|nr:HAD family phosphatase [Tabrizicola sp.]MDP3195933.1 HAD family phosphatase [Tabrizicola sp.]